MAKRSTRPARPAHGAGQSAPPAQDLSTAIRYLETSALLAAPLEKDPAARVALDWEGRRVTSSLTFAEGARAIVRARVDGRLNPAEERAAIRALQALERRCWLVAVSDAVLTRAGRPFPVEPMPLNGALTRW